MSVCLESSSSALPSQVGGKLPDTSSASNVVSSPSSEQNEAPKNVSKLIVASNHENAPPILQKVVNSSVITVVNTPITVVKTIGGTTTSHFTLVNNSVKSPAITLVNAPPITVVKSIEQQLKTDANNGNLPVAAVSEKTSGIHNVFVKKSVPAEGAAISIPDMPQSHKLLTANSFPLTNVIPNLNTGPILKTVNGQRNLNQGNKVKILSNVVMPGSSSNVAPGPSNSNVMLNKNHRFIPQKLVGNGATKYLNKPPDKRMFYPVHKSQLKTVYKPAPPKSLSPGAVQRTGAGLRTIPPQRPAVPNKTNYIGKHAVQAQKMKPKVKTKPMNNHASRLQHPPEQSAQMIFNQALTAQILETLSDKETSASSTNKVPPINSYLNTKYEPKPEVQAKPEPKEYKPQPLSTLDALSFVCQAVLLDHNYNATLPSEPTPPPVPPPPPINGTQQFSPVPNYPSGIGAIKRSRSTSQTILHREDDAASDISEERKIDTEGEETDTAPEAEAVSNEGNDRYGDYVTRCICGFIHDDGYMIECDRCKVWQHVRCVVKTKKVPEDYLCEECDPSKHTDRQKARALQQQWMREIQERDAKLRKEQMALTDTDSSDGETAHKNNRRKELPRRQRRDSMTSRSVARPGKRKERKMPSKRTKGKQTHAKSDDEKVPQLRQWIENYEEAVTNHYSPELRARISSIRLNGAQSELSGHVDPSVNKCKVQTNTGVKCLVANVPLPLGTPVIELRGKYMLSTQHRATTRQQRPGPFLFFHTLIKDTEVCVDTRTYGNCARFVRRSCTPNAELQHVIEKGTLHLYIVTTKSIDKGAELTIRHESHDIAAAHITEIPCACINPEYCALIKGHRRHNGDNVFEGRKRRGRQSRENMITSPPPCLPEPVVEEPIKQEIVKPKEEDEEEEIVEPEIKVKQELEEPKEEIILPEIKVETEIKKEKEEIKEEVIKEEPEEIKKEEEEIKEEINCENVKEEEEDAEIASPTPPVSTRRTSRHGQEPSESNTHESENKKLSREERKLQAIMKAIERMEKQEQRKQEHQAKQAHRRESEPTVNNAHKEDGTKLKRRKRKGRARTTSTNSRRNRLDSADSLHSSDETLLSPPSDSASPSKAAGLLLSLSNGDRKSPDRTMDSNSNSMHSSPETPLSSACLLVAAAVEPLEPGFKFPKTKKVLMNEWLNKSDIVQPASAISPSSLTPQIDAYPKNLSALVQTVTFCEQPRTGSAKKRWLRQAISEDQCDSPTQENPVAPPKKRRLPRESIQPIDVSPPDTPTNSKVQPQVEIITPQDEDSPIPMESDATLNELATEMRQEYGNCIHLPTQEIESTPPPERSIMDPRLAPRFTSEQLVGTVEKSLSFLGYDESKKPEAITPTKRKLSITEYRQRKKLNNNEKSTNEEISIADESNSSQSPKLSRTRSNSSSSVTSGSTTDDEQPTSVPEVKALSAFNSEPTELERQRESVSLRLKKALGLPVDETKKASLNVETLLKGDITLISKSPLTSPNFLLAGSGVVQVTAPQPGSSPCKETVEVIPYAAEQSEQQIQCDEPCGRKKVMDDKMEPVLFYTPDDEEMVEQTSYVPPFNNPLYPNTNYTTYGSVIDDDVPYEGRNPSPPPDMNNGA